MEKVTIVDAALAYYCKLTIKTYLLIARNSLYILSMENNLIPPFIMCEAGLLVDDVASICCGENVSHYSHCIIVIEADIEVRIPLILDGIFSYFPT